MYAKIRRRQVAWVLLASLMLIILCVSGLWIYIISADAETGVQETTVKTLLEEDNINITWEKYDNYPAIGKEEDLEQRFIGTGLTREEKARLPALLQAYADGKRPLSPAQPLTDADNISIVPLDPAEYAGLTEYYLLPGKALTEQKLLQLIDYSAKRGEAFSADMLTSKNCNRGGFSSSNRYLSAGEIGRWKILSRRAQMEGLSRFSPELSPKMLPVKGVGSMARDYEKFNNYGSFHFYPIRDMTDEELLQAICFENYQGYTNLKPENDERLDPIGDAARIRALMEEYMGMPIAAENYMLRYRRKNDDGETRLQAGFNTAAINGKHTNYFAVVDQKTGRYLNLSQSTWDQLPGAADRPDSTDHSAQGLRTAECVVIAKAFVAELTNIGIASNETSGASIVEQTDEHMVSEYVVNVRVKLTDGDLYIVNIRVSDGAVIDMIYKPLEQDDPFLW